MASTYEFKSIDEFVSYLDTRARTQRDEAKLHNPRSHKHGEMIAAAYATEVIANMVRKSNLVVVTDYMRAALSKAVG